MKRKYYIIAASFVMYSCTNDKIQGNQKIIPLPQNRVLVQKFDSKKIKSEQIFLKSKNALIPDGYYKEYYMDGNLKILCFYKKGIEDSVGYFYYPNEKMKSKIYKVDGHLYGPQYTYFENGNIESVTLHKNDTIRLFRIYYDQKESIRSMEGKPLSILPTRDIDNIRLGDSMTIVNVVLPLENIQSVLSIHLKQNSKIISDITVKKFNHTINTSFFPFNTIFRSAGSYKYTATIKLLDERGNPILQDSSSFSIKVHE